MKAASTEHRDLTYFKQMMTPPPCIEPGVLNDTTPTHPHTNTYPPPLHHPPSRLSIEEKNTIHFLLNVKGENIPQTFRRAPPTE